MPTYRRFTPQDAPRELVTVRVWTSMGRMMADVTPPDGVAPWNSNAVAEMPRTVLAALRRAEEVSRSTHSDQIAVVMEDGSTWRDDWGTLH